MLAGLALCSLVTPVLQNGDAAVYNDQIERGDLRLRAVHFGYLLLGCVFRRLLPGATDWQMNLMTVLLGTAGALAVYATTHTFTRCGPAALVAGLSVLAAPAYLRGMLASEVDVPIAVVIALAFALWVGKSVKLAGAVYGYAMLVSPLASLGLPAFLLTPPPGADAPDARRAFTAQLRRVALFGVVSLAVYLPVVVVCRNSYFNGGHGLLHAPRAPYELAAQWGRSMKFFGAERWLVALWLAGAVVAFTRGFRAWLAGILAVAVASVAFGERFSDVPVQLTTTTLAAPLAGFVVAAALSFFKNGRVAARLASASVLAALAALLFVTAARSLAGARDFVARLERERTAYLELGRAFPEGVVLVNPQSFQQARPFERVVYGRTHGAGHVISQREFSAACSEYARERHAFWFGKPPYSPPCRELAERYVSTTRHFQGTRFHLLVPRDEP